MFSLKNITSFIAKISKLYTNQTFLFALLFVILVAAGFILSFNSLDPDFGWHLKTGELIIKDGVPYQDWYSYTMPDFQWINHEWLLDVIIFKLYSFLGIHLLTLLFITIYTLSFFLYRKKYSFWIALFPISLAYLSTIGFLGIRAQLLTILFFAILVKIIDDFLSNTHYSSKALYFSPLIFLPWANLHGGFFLGLAVILAILTLEIFKKTKIWEKMKFLNFIGKLNLQEQPLSKIKVLFFVFISSSLITLINPYGWKIYIEVFRTIGDRYAASHILEWMPLFLQKSNIILIYTYILLVAFLIFVSYKKITLNKILISLFFLYLSISATRYFLVFVAWTLPIFLESLLHLKEQYDWQSIFSRYFIGKTGNLFIALLLIVLLPMVFSLYDVYSNAFSVESYYPEETIPFLKTIPLSENMFNFYGWGGYLIWNIPERKLFIDGRMAIWRQKDKFAFKDYIDVTEAQSNLNEIIEKYNISFFLLPKESRSQMQKQKNELSADSQKTGFLCLMLSCNKKNIYDELNKLGWKPVYSDQVSVILSK